MSLAEAYSIGSNFKLSKLKEWEPDYDYPTENAVVMWEAPEPNTEYTIGVDPSYGVGQDYSAIHVLRNGTLQRKDTQVAEFCSSEMSPHDLMPVCYMLGNLYKNTVEDTEALMSIECNLDAGSLVNDLRNIYNYSNLFIWKFYDNIDKKWSNKLGWWTTNRTRPLIILKAIHYVKQGWWDISSPWLLNEMQTIEKLEDKQRIEAAAGHHDDLFMAAAIALWSAHDMEFNEFGQVEEVAKKRERRTTGIVEAYDPVKVLPAWDSGKRKDFINTACSWNDQRNDDHGASWDNYFGPNN